MPEAKQCPIDESSRHALEWCQSNPDWQRFCDIEDEVREKLSITLDELPKKLRAEWDKLYPNSSPEFFAEFGPGFTRYRKGFIGQDGKFYDSYKSMPPLCNSMMVFRTGGPVGIYYDYGREAESFGKPRKQPEQPTE